MILTIAQSTKTKDFNVNNGTLFTNKTQQKGLAIIAKVANHQRCTGHCIN
jgi:hypothetical protein